MNKKKNVPWSYAAILFAILVMGLSGCSRNDTGAQVTTTPVANAAVKLERPAAAPTMSDFKNSIAEVARRTIPAVVHIEVIQRQEVSNTFQPFENNPFFHFFFNAPQNMPHKFKRELKGLGTGMIMDKTGRILTNNHVVSGATEINVLLADGHQYKATLVGTDPKTDLAVIKIDTKDALPYVTFGDSDQMMVGDWVVAIGHPRGLDQTVTQGIISAKHRRGIVNPSGYQDYLQTDAAINPGNSGGPLINLDGEVVGVNSAIVSESGGFEGIGFAIPSNMAVHIARQLMDHGQVVRGWLGVSIRDLTPDMAKKMNLENSKGALVEEVLKESPAASAGVKKGDVIVRFQNQAIDDGSALQNRVADTPIGETVSVAVVRDGETKTLTAKIGDLRDAVKRLAASVEDRLGATVRPLSEQEDARYGLSDGSGVAIAKVDSQGPLANAGFEKEDIIVAINNIPVSGVQGFADIVKALPSKQGVLLTAIDHRTGQTGYVQLFTQ